MPENFNDHCDDSTPVEETTEPEHKDGMLVNGARRVEQRLESAGKTISKYADEALNLVTNSWNRYQTTRVARVDTPWERAALAGQGVEASADYLGNQFNKLDQKCIAVTASINQALDQGWIDTAEFVQEAGQAAKIKIMIAGAPVFVAVDGLLDAGDELLTFGAGVITIVSESTGDIIDTIYDKGQVARGRAPGATRTITHETTTPAVESTEAVITKNYIVKTGDNLVSIAMNELGINKISQALAYLKSAAFSAANPDITNINVINKGDKVALPAID